MIDQINKGDDCDVPNLQSIFINLWLHFIICNLSPIYQLSFLNRRGVILKSNADFKILIASYCDSRGSDKFNIELSLRRSQAAQAYLIAHGINGSRIRIEYYGESNLVNNCADGVPCSPADQQLNRRSELFISKDGKKVLNMDCDWLEHEFSPGSKK